MQYRPLGATGINVSVIGFGAWGIGGQTPGATSYGRTDDAVSRRALNEAFDQGITFYDTASVYGDGHSEELIGECFAGRRDQVVIATKAGITSSFRGYDFSADALRDSLDASLRRLRSDYVDLFQLHNAGADVVMRQPHILDLLHKLRDQGKIRAFGFSTPSPQDAVDLLDVAGTAAFQINFNLLDWRAVDLGLFDRARERRIAIIARTPLAFGFLAGQIAKDTVFGPADHRSRWPREKIASWLDAADAIFAALTRTGYQSDRAAAALRFCMSFDAVATIIPGMLSPTEVTANVAACNEGPLDPSQLKSVESVYRLHQFRLDA